MSFMSLPVGPRGPDPILSASTGDDPPQEPTKSQDLPGPATAPPTSDLDAGSDAPSRLAAPLSPNASAVGERRDAILNGRLTENLRGGLGYGAWLLEHGLDAPAEHVAYTLHRLLPDAVPPNLSPAELAPFAAQLRVQNGTREGPLFDLLSARQGDEGAAERLAEHIEDGTLDVRAFAADPEEPPENWRFSFGFWAHNDNLAMARDGIYRSDDGATASFGVRSGWARGEPGDGERWDLSFGHNMFTERGGMSRSDVAELTVEHLRTRPSDRLFFDTVTTGWLVGLQGVGDFGGATVQDGFHAAMSGTALAGRRLGAGLQDEYTSDRQIAALLGARIAGTKRVGPFELEAGSELRLPIGGAGVGHLQPEIAARLANERGPQASVGLAAAYQWTVGDALAFDGAPREGFVLAPRVAVGWDFGRWNLGIEWQGNRWGTQEGFGDRNGESVAFMVSFAR